MSDPGFSKTSPESETIASSELPQELLAKLRIDIPGYTLLDKIAAGGQATVYRATELSSGMTVAIKVLHGGSGAGDWARDRLQREIVTLKALNHPNIVCVIESGCTPTGLDFLVMNYIAGQPLNALWTDFKFSAQVAPEPSDRLRLFKRICDIIQTAHLKGITHRDLSPSNILLTDDGEPHILDFGLASTAFNELLTPQGRQVSVTGQFLGKVQYASPEQARGGHDTVDIRTDVYALGVILYQILTNGAFPYEVVGNLIDVLNNIVHSKPLPPSQVLAARQKSKIERKPLRQIPPVVNETIEAIVFKALEKDPARRYQSAGELAADVDRYLAGQPTAAMAAPRSSARTLRRLTPIHQRLALGGVAILVLLIGCIAAVHSFKHRARITSAGIAPTAAIEGRPTMLVPQPLTRVGVYNGGGGWRMEGDELVQPDVTDSFPNVLFGDPNWGDFDLTMDVLRQSGSDLCAIIFHRTDLNHGYHYALGNLGNQRNDVTDWNGDLRLVDKHEFQLQNLRWYTIQIQARGDSFVCTLRDGDKTLDSIPFRANGAAHGQIGLITHLSAYRFRKLKVTAPDGKMLWEGFPDLPTDDKASHIAAAAESNPNVGSSTAATSIQAPSRDAIFKWGGLWKIQGTELRQSDTAAAFTSMVFGDPAWTDVDFTVDVLRETGAGSFSLSFHRYDGHRSYRYMVGDSGGTPDTVISAEGPGINRSLANHPSVLQSNKWYTAKVSVRGAHFICSLDDGPSELERLDCFNNLYANGQIGLATSHSMYRFRNLKVTAPDGKTLWDGFPNIPPVPGESPARPDEAQTAQMEAEPAGARTVNLLSMVDLERDVVAGHWRKDSGTLWCDATPQSTPMTKLEFPYVPPAEYDLHLVFIPQPENFTTNVVCCAAETRFVWTLFPDHGVFSAFEGHANVNETMHPVKIAPGRRYITTVKVRRNEVKGFLNGLPVTGAELSHLSMPSGFSLHHSDTVGVCLFTTTLQIISATVTEISGPGRVLHDQNESKPTVGPSTQPQDAVSK